MSHKGEGKLGRKEMTTFTEGHGIQSPREMHLQSYELPLPKVDLVIPKLLCSYPHEVVMNGQQDEEKIESEDHHRKIMELVEPASVAMCVLDEDEGSSRRTQKD